MPNFPIYILGQGSIGSVIAAKGLSLGLNMVQVVRAGSRRNHEVKLGDNNYFLTSKKELNEIEKIDFLIVPIKAYDIVSALTEVKPYLSANAIVVISHNGLGTIDACKDLLGNKASIYFCTTSTGAYSKDDVVYLSGIGKSEWSELSHSALANQAFQNKDTVADVISAVFYNAQYVNDLRPILWNKLAVNAVINPITALNNITNGDILNNKYQSQVDAVLNEFIAVASAAGINLQFNSLKNLVLSVAKKTANNSSSMREDTINGKKTEIDFINGYITKKAAEYGISTPVNEQIVSEVKALFRL